MFLLFSMSVFWMFVMGITFACYLQWIRACFNVQWCTKCTVMNENVQRWTKVCS